MPQKNKRRPVDYAQITGAIILTSLLVILIVLGIFYDAENQFTSSFFDDVSNAMQWK